MTPTRRLALAVTVCLLGGGPAMAQTAAPSDQCERAGRAAELAHGIPPGLLLAIGRVESGRWDPNQSRVAPWPWAINAAGKGMWFNNPTEAIETVRAARAAGTQSIDTGCFQISLMYHPLAFTNLEQAFDPAANADYAARFLVELYARLGSWDAAVANYHSADPTLGETYRRQVLSNWTAPEPAAAALLTPEPEPVIPVVIEGVRVWTPMRAGSAPNAIPLTAPDGPLPVVVPHRFTPAE